MIFLKLGTREGVIDDVVSGGAQDHSPAALYIYFHSSTLHSTFFHTSHNNSGYKSNPYSTLYTTNHTLIPYLATMEKAKAAVSDFM